MATVGSLALAPPPCHALTFSVNSTLYRVSTFQGSYNSNAAKFSAALMPWWNSPLLAQAFTTAIYKPSTVVVNPFVSLFPAAQGFPSQTINGVNLLFAAPMIAWQTGSDGGGSFVQWNAAYTGDGPAFNPSSPQLMEGGKEYDLNYTDLVWLTAEQAEVPAPLPGLGAAAATLWCRTLRRRIRT